MSDEFWNLKSKQNNKKKKSGPYSPLQKQGVL
jgi:hypothetical protein